jgi:hypothetical protein
MAATGLRKLLNFSANTILVRNRIQVRNIVTTETGSILEAPQKKGILGFAGVAVAVTTGITIGSLISKDVASFLEENDLFVPSDDDDD